MTRHARNCTAGSVYTYHEKKKDTQASGYGSKDVRLGKDSIKDFDCCCLTLQPCANPVVTPDGFLFDKEAILEYILHQKKEISRKLKEYEKQKTRLEKEESALGNAEEQGTKRKFVEQEASILTKPLDPFTKKQKINADAPSTSDATVSNMANGKDKQLPSFWLPSLTPKAEPTLLKKPSEKILCPMSGKPLRLKDLIDVKFTEIKDRDDKRSLIVKDARYVCAVTNDVLGNSVPCAVLKTSGHVVTMECVEKIIKKDMIDPTNGKKLQEKDIIQLQRGATGFSGAGVKLNARKEGPSLMC